MDTPAPPRSPHFYRKARRHLAGVDADWADLLARVGPCRLAVRAGQEPHEALIRAVSAQQIHGKAAQAILARFLALYGAGDDFPAPARVLATPPETLRACGFSARKVETIHGIAQGALDGLVPRRREAESLDDEALVARLTQLRGIGRWTVEMLLIFTLGRADVLPVDDFGVREGYRRLKGLAAQPKPKELAAAGEAWRPWRSVAAWYLWRATELADLRPAR